MTYLIMSVKVNENEVQALMLHHLELAAALFEALPGDIKVHRSVLAELQETEFDPWAEAALIWFDKLDAYYAENEG